MLLFLTRLKKVAQTNAYRSIEIVIFLQQNQKMRGWGERAYCVVYFGRREWLKVVKSWRMVDCSELYSSLHITTSMRLTVQQFIAMKVWMILLVFGPSLTPSDELCPISLREHGRMLHVAHASDHRQYDAVSLHTWLCEQSRHLLSEELHVIPGCPITHVQSGVWPLALMQLIACLWGRWLRKVWLYCSRITRALQVDPRLGSVGGAHETMGELEIEPVAQPDLDGENRSACTHPETLAPWPPEMLAPLPVTVRWRRKSRARLMPSANSAFEAFTPSSPP